MSTSVSLSVKAITYPQYPPVEVCEDAWEDVRKLEWGDLATNDLKEYAWKKKPVDTTFGIRCCKDGEFDVGKETITIEGVDITIEGKRYVGTGGLWLLLTMANPNKFIYANNDWES